jgi:hypothetical protein
MVADGDVTWASSFALTPGKRPLPLTGRHRRKETEMRRSVLLVLVLALGGCAAGNDGDGVATANGGAPAATATTAPPAEEDGLKFAQCMRDNGLPSFEDPEPGERGVRIAIPPGTDKTKVDAAMQACKRYLPHGGEPPKLDARALEQARQMAKCMRENGVPDFPDPQPDGGVVVDGSKFGAGPGAPAFDAAQKACARFQPFPPSDGPQTDRRTP